MCSSFLQLSPQNSKINSLFLIIRVIYHMPSHETTILVKTIYLFSHIITYTITHIFIYLKKNVRHTRLYKNSFLKNIQKEKISESIPLENITFLKNKPNKKTF